MKRRDEIKKFSIKFDHKKDIDVELLEPELHSLYKLKNIYLDEASYINDLKQCNPKMTALNIARKSFIKALKIALERHNISLDDFNISTVDSYSSYVIEMIWDKDYLARNLRKEIREGVGIDGKKLNLAQRASRFPLAIFAYTPNNYFFNKEKLTKSAAYKKMLDDLMTWEKDIIVACRAG